MRIVVDVSPLSHRRTGIGNYIRGSLAGIAEAAGGEHELVAFAPASPAGRREIDAALDGLPVERWLPTLPLAHVLRVGWSDPRRSDSSASSTCSTSATGCIRRNGTACARR